MTKKDLTALAKSHNADIVSEKRAWGLYYIPADKFQSFINALIPSKAQINSHYVKKENAYSVMVTLEPKKNI